MKLSKHGNQAICSSIVIMTKLFLHCLVKEISCKNCPVVFHSKKALFLITCAFRYFTVRILAANFISEKYILKKKKVGGGGGGGGGGGEWGE